MTAAAWTPLSLTATASAGSTAFSGSRTRAFCSTYHEIAEPSCAAAAGDSFLHPPFLQNSFMYAVTPAQHQRSFPDSVPPAAWQLSAQSEQLEAFAVSQFMSQSPA
jgi:hypothetical protein